MRNYLFNFPFQAGTSIFLFTAVYLIHINVTLNFHTMFLKIPWIQLRLYWDMLLNLGPFTNHFTWVFLEGHSLPGSVLFVAWTLKLMWQILMFIRTFNWQKLMYTDQSLMIGGFKLESMGLWLLENDKTLDYVCLTEYFF